MEDDSAAIIIWFSSRLHANAVISGISSTFHSYFHSNLQGDPLPTTTTKIEVDLLHVQFLLDHGSATI
jgi:hypothetical protein